MDPLLYVTTSAPALIALLMIVKAMQEHHQGDRLRRLGILGSKKGSSMNHVMGAPTLAATPETSAAH